MAQCEANRKRGGACKNHAVRGANVCRMHGGSAPQVRRAAKARVAVARVASHAPAWVDPADALEDALARITAGAASAAVSGSPREQLDWLVAQLKAADMVLRVGIAEFRRRVAEKDAQQLYDAVAGALDDVGLDTAIRERLEDALAVRLRRIARGEVREAPGP